VFAQAVVEGVVYLCSDCTRFQASLLPFSSKDGNGKRCEWTERHWRKGSECSGGSVEQRDARLLRGNWCRDDLSNAGDNDLFVIVRLRSQSQPP